MDLWFQHSRDAEGANSVIIAASLNKIEHMFSSQRRAYIPALKLLFFRPCYIVMACHNIMSLSTVVHLYKYIVNLFFTLF